MVQSNEPSKVVVWMKRGETLGGVLRIRNVILLELRKVREEVINVGVLRDGDWVGFESSSSTKSPSAGPS